MGKRFLEEGDLLLLYYPFNQGVIGFRILGVSNKNFDYWTYGPLPFSFPDSNNVLHEVGVIPQQFVNLVAYRLPNNLPGLQSQYTQDIMYHEDPSILYHMFIDFGNVLLRNYLQIPFGIPAAELYKTTLNPPADVGFKAGEIEFVAQPFMSAGWFTLNETNRNLRTNLIIRIASYQVAVVQNPNLLYRMVTRQERNVKSIVVGGPRWSTDKRMFQVYGLESPIPVIDILKTSGGVASNAFTAPSKGGVIYE